MNELDYQVIPELMGKTMIDVRNKDDEELVFTDTAGNKYIFYHQQDCCESVVIDDICGELEDLIGSPIVQAEETWNNEETGFCESETWTFYKFATAKGYVTVKWFGSSNGYYSESVDFREEPAQTANEKVYVIKNRSLFLMDVPLTDWTDKIEQARFFGNETAALFYKSSISALDHLEVESYTITCDVSSQVK